METNIDLGRMNRKERRNLSRRIKLTIPGRTLPYNKQAHGSIKNYYELLENDQRKEAEEKNNGTTN